MTNFLINYYLYIKALHIVSVMFWMAGMFYLPRLFVYHCRAKVGTEMYKTFCEMESRLIKIIITPAMVASLIFGLLILLSAGFSSYGYWMHGKLTLLIFMFALHGVSIKYAKQFIRGENNKSEKFYRIFNEGAPILALFIILLAVVKPF